MWHLFFFFAILFIPYREGAPPTSISRNLQESREDYLSVGAPCTIYLIISYTKQRLCLLTSILASANVRDYFISRNIPRNYFSSSASISAICTALFEGAKLMMENIIARNPIELRAKSNKISRDILSDIARYFSRWQDQSAEKPLIGLQREGI